MDDYDKATTIAPKGGTCTVATVPDNGAVTTTRYAACTPNASCAPAACGGYAPEGFTACIVMPGDVACPASSAFTVKHLGASHVNVQCTDCGTACTFEGSCASPTLSFYSDNQCKTLITSIPADSTCDATGHQNALVGGTTYTATASFTGCTATNTSTGTPAPQNPRTFCCHP